MMENKEAIKQLKNMVVTGRMYEKGNKDMFFDDVNALHMAIAALKRQDAKVDGNTSDGYHTFNELYHHRAVLFSIICNDRPELAWKSKKHSDGTMFDDFFIVGIDTPNDPASYHYKLEYWDMFRVKEIEFAPEYDGYTPKESIERIGSLERQINSQQLRAALEQLICEYGNYMQVDAVDKAKSALGMEE